MDDKLIQSALDTYSSKRVMLNEFYLPSSGFGRERGELESKIAGIVLDSILETRIEDILDVIEEKQERISAITTANIPIYSNIYDVDAIPKIVESNKKCDHTLIGYYFKKDANEEAQRKYGATHYKIAELLGLVTEDEPLAATCFGLSYMNRDQQEKERLRPRLCLRVPIIQKYLIGARNGPIDGMKELRIMLTESSAIRRRSSIKQMLNQIYSCLPSRLRDRIIANINWK